MTDDPTSARPATFTLRLTPEDRLRLERDAAGMSLGSYVRWRLFNPDTPPPRTRNKAPVKDHESLMRVLGLLGQSRLANNLNQLARAAHTGSLPITPDTEQALQLAAAEIAEMRSLLLQAIGLEPD